MRVVIAEDQVLLREGLGRLFADGGHEVVASMGDARRLLPVVAAHQPDLVVVDVRMPPSFTDEGAQAASELKQLHPDLGVLLLSQHIETTHVVDLVRLGGFGYLLKDRVLDVAEFLQAAERVAQGGSALDPQVVGSLVSARGPGDPLAGLTEREREVLELMAQGKTNTGIAKRLYLSERTVEAHVRHVLMKLDIPETDDAHRRVLAVLTHVSATRPGVEARAETPRLDGAVKTVTVLFTDLVGSTELASRVGPERAESLRLEHFSLLREVIATSNGREVKTLGDGMMVVFSSAAEAIACAAAMQQRIELRNRNADQRFGVRVGVAMGDASCVDRDYFGPPVVEAARICAQARGGQILLTEVTRTMVGRRGGHNYPPIGPIDLKGLPEPVAACELLWEPLPSAPALPRAPRTS